MPKAARWLDSCSLASAERCRASGLLPPGCFDRPAVSRVSRIFAYVALVGLILSESVPCGVLHVDKYISVSCFVHLFVKDF